MAEYRAQLPVAAPADEAYRYLADLTNLPEWYPSVVEVQPGGDATIVVAAFFGRRIELPFRTETATPNRELVFVSNTNRIAARLSLTFEPFESGCVVTYHSSTKLKGALKLFERGLQITYDTAAEKAVAKLAETLGALSRRG